VDGSELGAVLQENADRSRRMNQEVFMRGSQDVVEWMREQKRSKYDIVLSPESAGGGDPPGFSALWDDGAGMADGDGGELGGAHGADADGAALARRVGWDTVVGMAGAAGGAHGGDAGGWNGYGGRDGEDGAAQARRAGWETVVGLRVAGDGRAPQARLRDGGMAGFEPVGHGARGPQGAAGDGWQGAEAAPQGQGRQQRQAQGQPPMWGQEPEPWGQEQPPQEQEAWGQGAQPPWEQGAQPGGRGDPRKGRNGKQQRGAAPQGGRGGHPQEWQGEPPQGRQPEAQYRFPEPGLLNDDTANKASIAKIRAQTQETAMLLEDALHSFKVRAKVVGISRGPSVTRYDMQPDIGVKASTIINLAEDISIKLASSGIRIAPVANMAAVGIEVPNREVSTVYLKEIIDSEAFARSKSPLTFAIGKDLSGSTIVADIAKMPHLLVAGATGSGKSVCVNCLIASLLYKSSPEDVKLILVDPKVVELGIYNGIPHLLIPVVTDPKKAAGALNWAVQEMMSRYKAFSERKVKEITGYNDYVARTGDGEKMPRIVIIIDELADLMMAAPKEVEDYIIRLTQLARAAGMHMVIATQRPSVNVITGLIKANIPSRVAFAVSSQIDSRTILDMAGAEKLLGKGDMLFHPVGEKKPVRVQGAFISESEVERIVEYVKVGREADYDEDIIEKVESAGQNGPDEDAGASDELLPRAVEFAVDAGQASASMIQRKLSVGYARAARIVDQMEARGIVGGFDGSKPRQVLISRQQLHEMKF
jgi:DNA segregation ATPase FtsK/SpoIIIE-like protein